jgi:membrane fusion protein (multidrug efflux system)
MEDAMARHFRRRSAWLFGVVVAVAAISSAAAQSQQPSAVPVNVITAEKRAVSEAGHFVGRIEAIERVDLRARVTGFLEAVLFKDGERVKAGMPLYRIEKPPFQAKLQQAQADVLRAKAQLDNATVQRERADELVKSQSTSVAIRDDRVAQEKTAQGSFAAAEAERTTAEISLGYTDIVSPIDGQIGRSALTRGNVVSPDAGVLATIVSIDPMYVTFPVSQREFVALREKNEGRTLRREDYKVGVRFSNGTIYPQSGSINFVDVKVDRATDTITVRATLPNREGVLVDGQLVQVVVEGDKAKERVLVPQVALIADQEGPYVFIVEDAKAAMRRIKVGQTSGTSVIVESGLTGGEMVVIGGAQSLRPGVSVRATPVQKPLGG